MVVGNFQVRVRESPGPKNEQIINYKYSPQWYFRRVLKTIYKDKKSSFPLGFREGRSVDVWWDETGIIMRDGL